jgi:hypothetical protein
MKMQKIQPDSPTNNRECTPLDSGSGYGAVASYLALATLVAMAIAGSVPGKAAADDSLSGSWSGGGWVSFSSGNKEKARCRARYRRAGGNSYELDATCATASGSASQTATVYSVSPNHFRGTFHNVEYNVTGSIRIVVSGNSQSVSLAGEGASAALSLSRR